MKFLQHQMNQVLSNKKHESSSDSNAFHRCIHVDVYHEKFGNLNVLDAFEYVLEEIQTLDVVEEELEFSLDEGYAIFKEEHDSSTLEPIYDKGFTL